MSGKAKIGIETQPLSAESVAIAEKELRETPEIVRESIKELRELLKESTHLYFDDSEDFLIFFLRPTKFYPKSALALMQRVADFKVKNATHVKNLLPKDEYTTFVENRVVNVLADRDQDGRRILIMNVGATWDTSKVTAEQIFKCLYLIHQTALAEPETQVRGVVVIMDYKGMSLRHVRAMGPSFAMLLLTFIQDAMPLRLKQVHMVNEPLVFNAVFTLFKPFIKEKLRNRMFFHGKKMDSLHKHIDPDYLPEDYGGKKPKIDYSSADWYPLLESLTPAIEKWNSYGLVEA